jgi:hypothetical protein
MHRTVTSSSVVSLLDTMIPCYDSESLCLQSAFLENSITRTRDSGAIKSGTGRALAGFMTKYLGCCLVLLKG